MTTTNYPPWAKTETLREVYREARRILLGVPQDARYRPDCEAVLAMPEAHWLLLESPSGESVWLSRTDCETLLTMIAAYEEHCE